MAVRPEKQKALTERMAQIGITASDIEEKFIIGSGKGGQKQNKSATAVQLKHLPSGIVIKCQSSRSRELNRFLARRLLCDRLEKGDDLDVLTPKQIKARNQKKRRARRHKKKESDNASQVSLN